jgi:ribosome-binding factor A
MSTRRLNRISKLIQTVVSGLIQNHIADPRIQGLISITRVETSADLSHARIFLRVAGVSEQQQKLSLEGIRHAGGFIRSRLAHELTTKTCPSLTFALDDRMQKELEVLNLIDQVSREFHDDRKSPENAEIPPHTGPDHEEQQ